MSASVVSAAVSILDAALPDDVAVFHSRVVGAPPNRYVIVTGGTGRRYQETYSDADDFGRVSVRATIVALLPKDTSGTPGPRAEWLANAVDAALIGVRPTVDGKLAGRFRSDGSVFRGSDEQILDRQSAYYVNDYSLIVS